jgi:hypothetical protein
MEINNLKIFVRGAYDLQKLRIQMGNRIVANFKARLGQKAGESEETLDEKGKELLSQIRKSYKKITDNVKTFPRQSTFTGDQVISTFTELCLVAQYVSLETQEDSHFKRLGSMLNEYPIFTEYLKDVRGIGPAMAGVLISEIDIEKCQYPSSLWKYCGLDVVAEWTLDRVVALVNPDKIPHKFPEKRPFYIFKDQFNFLHFEKEGEPNELHIFYKEKTLKAKLIYVWTGDLKGRSKKKEHLVQTEYIDKNNEVAFKMGITFNPWLKSKLIGVLASSFLRAGDNIYSQAYRDYKNRIENHPDHLEKTKGHRHNMAMRYMIKIFLIDFHRTWRAIEELPVTTVYSKGKLGIVHKAG